MPASRVPALVFSELHENTAVGRRAVHDRQDREDGAHGLLVIGVWKFLKAERCQVAEGCAVSNRSSLKHVRVAASAAGQLDRRDECVGVPVRSAPKAMDAHEVRNRDV